MSASVASSISPPTERTRRGLLLVWCVFLAFSASLYLLRLRSDGPYGKDFTIFLTGARIIVAGDAPRLYDLKTQEEAQGPIAGRVKYAGGVLPFNYPPYVAALFVPLTSVPPDIAYYAWVAVLWVVLIGLAVWVAAYFRAIHRQLPRTLILVLFSFAPIYEALLMGQMSIVLLALWWWAFVSWRGERWGQLGIAVALAAFKPQMAVLLLVGLLIQKRWRALGYVVATQVVLWGAALLIGGPGIVAGYVDMLRLSASTVGTLGFNPAAMPNLRGLLALMGLSSDLDLQVSMMAWLASIGAAAYVWRMQRPIPVRFGLVVLLAVLFSPHLYIHDASLLALAIICAYVASSQEERTRLSSWTLASLLILFLAMYSLVLGVASSYLGVILSVWVFSIVMLLIISRLESARHSAGRSALSL